MLPYFKRQFSEFRVSYTLRLFEQGGFGITIERCREYRVISSVVSFHTKYQPMSFCTNLQPNFWERCSLDCLGVWFGFGVGVGVWVWVWVSGRGIVCCGKRARTRVIYPSCVCELDKR